jgi:hypothetical protein
VQSRRGYSERSFLAGNIDQKAASLQMVFSSGVVVSMVCRAGIRPQAANFNLA